MARLQTLVRALWQHLRDACGENDYMRYRARIAPGERPMTPEAFYLSRLRQKYARPSRCC